MGAPEERALAEPPELGTRGGTERTKCKNIFDAAPDPGCPGRGRTALTRVRRLRGALALAAALSITVAGLAVYITVLKGRQCSEQPQTKGALSTAGKDVVVLPPCGDGWIWYQYKCYYFSEDEGDWTAAKDSCAALNSSLALIDTQKELTFILRYKGDYNHWIGLRRDNKTQPWTWVNGTRFNNWFTVSDASECAYLGYIKAKSLECVILNNWICTKVITYE
ncbi:hypothetical protein NDU88_000658 [Pleurodeles waltl]|uniref:C-type lectin domain-containing protein n=1 Tax=Pleurodeles waltl TaxID=8319 RepID=A0AAV7P4U7_PLEWA|nr:hypothetical protein NDU88_000658 [Pleurodeles waltl]